MPVTQVVSSIYIFWPKYYMHFLCKSGSGLRAQVLHLHTTSKIIVLYILIFGVLDRPWKDNNFTNLIAANISQI
jgi:hypothetical protein